MAAADETSLLWLCEKMIPVKMLGTTPQNKSRARWFFTSSVDTFAIGRGVTPGATMHTCEIEVERDGRWWMIRIPELDSLTQARWPGEIRRMARDYIAVSTSQPIDNVAVRIVRSRWWKRAKRQT
jgi:hypothetical protein